MFPPSALTPIYDGLRTGSFCGLVCADGWTLEILPKIYDRPGMESDRGLLVRMLASCFDIPVWHGDAAESGSANLISVIVRTFLEEASTQLRVGWIKSYVTFSDQLTRPKGRLKLQQQIRRGRAQGHKLHCDFDELTIDNAHNQFVKAALGNASSKTPAGSRDAAVARKLVVSMDDVSEAIAASGSLQIPTLHRLSQRYERLLMLSSWILRLLAPDVHSGPEKGMSLLFDMNRLFQDYVGTALDRAIHRHPLRERFRLTRERPVKNLVADDHQRMQFSLRPDFCLQLDGKIVAIIDTKWKRLQPDELHAGVGQADLYQLLAYGHTYSCKQLLLVYPDSPALDSWQRPNFRFSPHDVGSIGLSLQTFDLENDELSAERLLNTIVGRTLQIGQATSSLNVTVV